MKGYLLEKIKESGCEKNVRFVEHLQRPELVEYYRRSTLAVVPSLWENFPYACMEAMSCGKPVIASRTGGISEMVEDGIDGILVSPGSVHELVQKAVALLSDEKLRLKLGSKARENVLAKFSPRAVAEKTLAAYGTVRGKR
jgi:glycosyltransferase involved in cell wall biosynthesis